MSIQSQITRLSANVSDAFAAIESKGVTVPSGSKSDDLADLIGQIPTGSGSAITVVDTQDEHGGIIRTISGVSLAGDTVAADKLLLGYTAHNYLGQPIVGTYQGGGGSATISSLNITPSESAQTFNASDVDGYKPVSVSAISSTYVGSGITRRSSTDLSASSSTITVPAGYYSSQATKSVSSGSATAPTTISGTSATVSTGTNTLTLSKTISVTPTVTAGYISSGTAGNANVSLSASVTTQAAQTIYPSSSDQSIASGRYLTGAQTIKAVTTSNLTAENIKSGVTVTVGDSADADRILSIVGTYSGGGGGGVGTLLKTTSMGTQSTTSTTATDTGISLSVSGVNDYDLLIVETSVDSVVNNRHLATVGLIFLTASSAVDTKNGASIATVKWNSKISSSGVVTTRAGTTAYGIYPNSCTVATSNNVTTATIPMYRRYNSTSTGTLNGAYTARVYGVSLYDLIGG